MRNFFNIFVEGEADARFFGQYINHVLGESIPEERLVILNGWNNLKTETYAMRMRSMTANGGINLVILDADKDIEARRHDIVAWKQASGVQFNLFLLPNDKDSGALEDMLERIINPVNRPILDCWEDYEKELVKLDIPGRTPPPLTTPAKKTKIYGYLEALLGETRSQKELIKEVNRNYQDKRHWNLDAEYLEPLKSFLCQYI
jgi:hypothetical protein